MKLREFIRKPVAKIALVTLAFAPFAWLCVGIFSDRLGPNPAEYLIRSTGTWTLRFLCITLAVTPLRVISGWPEWLRFRRSLGLMTFFYASMHALCYSLIDMGWDWPEIVADVVKRPFIAVGLTSLVLLSLLASTSFNAAVRALGVQRWRRLHQTVYVIAALAVLHFYWMRSAKQNFSEVVLYGAILALLMAWRIWHAWRVNQSPPGVRL